MMLLIDAVYIHETGGKVLLEYIVEELEKTNIKIFYLFDDRIALDKFSIKSTNKFLLIKGSYFTRLKFYLKNRRRFSKILCFANVPPPVRMNAKVYTFFHQLIYLEIPKKYPIKNSIIYFFKTKVIKFLKQNTDFWIVQNENVKRLLSTKFKETIDSILLLPFYPPVAKINNVARNSAGFLYVSNPFPHKNHYRLIDAFCLFYDIEKRGELILTVDKSYTVLHNYIQEKIKKGYPIRNVGYIKRSSLSQLYSENKFVIFPSLAESFGLGIVEGLDNGCEIIGADLKYTYEVCEPSLVFNPCSVQSIKETMMNAISKNDLRKSKTKVKNKIEDLIELLLK